MMKTDVTVMSITPAFQKISDASKTTGLSQYELRKRLRENRLPHIRVGVKALVNISALLAQLEEESLGE